MEEPVPYRAKAALMGLIVLTGLNLLNYLDRMIPAAVEESLKTQFSLQDQQFGLLTPAFVVVLMLASPVFGMLGDSGSRTRLIAFGVAIWSVATASAGLCHSFNALLVSRMVVGIGEAAYGTIAPSLLADYFPRQMRGRIFSIFYVAIPVGSALGYLVGGYVNHYLNWRWAFCVAGIPGLLLAALCLRLYDPPRGSQDDAVGGHGKMEMPLWKAYQTLGNNHVYALTVLGYAAVTWATAGLGAWMPAFLSRVRHFQQSEGDMLFGGIIAVSGLVGTMAGGWLGDYLLKYTRHAYLWLSGVTTLLAVPFSVMALLIPDRAIFLPCLCVAATLIFCSTGPINTTIINVVSPAMRATAVAASTLTIHLLGDATSPYLIGVVSDKLGVSDPSRGLALAVLLVPVVVGIGGAIWSGTAWWQQRTNTVAAAA